MCNFGKINSNKISFTYGSENTTNSAVTRYGSFQFAPYILPLTNSLPLRILSIGYTTANNYATIHWTTADEYDLQKIVVQRSYNGLDFEDIAILAPHNRLTGATYTYTDNVLLTSKVYYRIKAVDFNGKYIISTILKVVSNNNNIGLYIYPNPSKGAVYMKYTSSNAAYGQYKIYNSTGTLVSFATIQVSKGVNVITVHNLQNLAKGNYMIQLYKNNEYISTATILMQ